MDVAANLLDKIQSIPWFNELNSVQIDRLAKIAHLYQAQAGEELFHEGDRVDQLYVILSGQVLLENYIPTVGNHVMSMAEPLDVIGWSCLTPVVRQRMATARVKSPALLITIKGESLIGLCEEDTGLGYIIMRRIANIIASQYLNARLHLFEIIHGGSTP